MSTKTNPMNTENAPVPEAILHGELLIVQSKLPEGATLIEPGADPFMIIAPSETTGNHHVVDLAPGIAFYELRGKRYMVNDVPATVRCILPERHDDEILEPGCWEIDAQQEFDPFAQRMVNVYD